MLFSSTHDARQHLHTLVPYVIPVICITVSQHSYRLVITHQHKHNRAIEDLKALNKGMLSEDSVHKLSRAVKSDTLIKVMERFDMLIQCEIDERKMYLVPCMRRKVKEGEVISGDKLSIPSIPFRCVSATELKSGNLNTLGFLPPGLFHRLISKRCRLHTKDHFKNLIFYDYIVFKVSDFSCALRMVDDDIILSAFKFRGDVRNYSSALSNLREEIEGLLASIIKETFPSLAWVIFLECPCVTDCSSTQSRWAMIL